MKKSRTVLAIVFTLVGCLSASSQVYNDFDLKTFLVPDITRNALDFKLNSSGEMNDRQSSDNDSYSIEGNLGAKFNRFQNSRSFWSKQSAEIGLGGNYGKVNSSDTKSSTYNVAFSYSNISRFYREKNIFLGIGGNVSTIFNGEKYKQRTESERDLTDINFYVPISMGKGRLEVVTDARQAIYILENLNRQGVMKRKLSNEEILTLSRIIAQVKNKRFLDSRIRMIEEISTVDSFFVKNDLLTTNGASYFTTLYDYWMYGDRFERLSGLVIEGMIRPGFQYSHSKQYNNTEGFLNENESKYKTTTPSVRASVSLAYENPVNLFWQQSGYIELYGSFMKYLNKGGDFTDQRYLNGGISGYYKWGYYPTSRTNINWGVTEFLMLDNRKDDIEGAKSFSSFNTTTSLFFETYYYFSPQLRLSAKANINYNYQKDLPEWSDYEYSQFNPSFELKLTYSLF